MKILLSKKICAIIILIVIAVAFYVMNVLTPLYCDDYAYTRNFVTKEPISSISDIFESMGIHYLKVNGRVLLHFLAQLFLWVGKDVFNVINTVAFVVLVSLAYYLSCGTFQNFSSARWFIIAAGIFLLAPGFGQSYLWVTGSANYLFGMVLILGFLSLFVYNMNENKLRGVFAAITFFIFGVFSGGTNENTAVALIVTVMLVIAFQKINTKKIHPWMISGLAGNIVGFASIIFAPGERVRISGTTGVGSFPVWISRALSISGKVLVYFWPVMIVAIILFVVFFIKNKKGRFQALSIPGIYFIAMLVCTYSMVLSPSFPERAWSGTTIFGMITLMSIYNATDVIAKPLIKKAIVAFVMVISAAVFCVAIKDLNPVKIQFDAREESVVNQIAAGKKDLCVDSITSNSKYSCFETYGDIEYDKNDWKNIAFARYWNAETVTKGEK